MICCLGLFLGLYAGSILGGIWTLIGPVAGFGVGLMLDMRLMHGMHGKDNEQEGSCHQGRRLNNDEEKNMEENTTGTYSGNM